MAAALTARYCTHCARWTLAVVALTVSGCATANHAERGALVGGGLGAGTGAIIGHQSGNKGAGAALGGALGMLGGALVGSNQDAWEQRDAAMAQLAASSRPMHPPLTNFDLIRMAQSGLGDDVIFNAVQSRGGQFDLSPDGLIALKSSGVSEQVIQRVQTAGANLAPAQQVTPVAAVVPPPGIVIVRPRPIVDVHLGPPPVHIGIGPPPRHSYRRHRHPPRSGFAFSWHQRL